MRLVPFQGEIDGGGARRGWAGVFVFVLSLSLPVFAEADQQAELDQLRTRIKQIAGQLNADKAKRNTTQDQLAEVELNMAEINRALRTTKAGIQAGKRKINASEIELDRLGKQVDARRTQLESLIYATYVAGRAEYFKLLLNQEDPSRLGRNMAYYRYLSRARVDDILHVEQLAAELNRMKSGLEEEYRELKVLQADQLSNQEDLTVARIERSVLLSKLEQRIDSGQAELTRLKRDAERLEHLLRDLGKTLPGLEPGDALDRRFSEMRGKLALPISGPISARFGQSRGETDIPWQGIYMVAKEGTVVRSIFSGRVAFADWLRGFGLLLILDHGDGYMSLYSHNQVLYKQVGEWVDIMEPIAQVGSSGGMKRTGLYFEIRHNGEPYNPLNWCKLE